MMRFFVGRLAILTGTALLAFTGCALAADICAAPPDLTSDIQAIPHVAAVLKDGGALDVLTVGSATVFSPMETLRPGTVTGRALGLAGSSDSATLPSPSEAAFPLQMAEMLRNAVPGLKVSVVVKGGRGMTASDMLGLIRSETAEHHYQLVIWQTGTVEAVHNMPASAFYDTLLDGSTTVAKSGADLILVDPQFSRFLRANADLDPYARSMQQIAAQPGAMLFHRYDLMQYWANEGQIDLERTPKGQRLQAVELLHACLGASLAHMITAAVHLPS